MVFRERRFALIVSDTVTQSDLFLGAIKQALQENDAIIDLFGIKRNSEGKVEFIKDSESDIIVEFTDGEKFRIISKGSEQKLRGLLWNGKRPDLIICDDLENDEIVMNKDRREKFKRWFNGALLPCRSANGIIRIVGTILHMDSMLEGLMPKERDRNTEFTDLKMWSTKKQGAWISVKYKAHNEDFSKILWPAKWTAQALKEERANYITQGLSDVYSQEYLNVPIDESNLYFRRKDFLNRHPEDRKKKLNYYIAGDLAISEKERADWTVFVVGGMDEHNVLHIVNVIRERMDGREIVDTILSLQKIYEPLMFGIEDMQVSKSIGPFLNEEMLKWNTFPNVVPLKPHKTDKIMRARSIQARMRANGVKFEKDSDWYSAFEEEMMRFPRDRHDDQVDAMAYLGLMVDKFVEAPTKEEELDEEYYDEMERSGFNNMGRSVVCGY